MVKGEKREIRTQIKPNMLVKELLEQFGGAGFNAKRMYEAYNIWQAMRADKNCVKFLTLAGALVAGGMRDTIVKTINAGLVDAIVATGGSILTHDLIEAFGVKHLGGTPQADDEELAKQDLNRIYDVQLPNKGFEVLEETLRNKLFPKLPQEELSPTKFLQELGKHVEDKNSIIKAASKKGIPIFCPSITDSILGFQAWMYGQENSLKIQPQQDIADFLETVWKNKKFGLIILGGGVPKHFVAGMMQVSGKPINYAVQITLDRPEHGGVSGAQLSEAKSWKKVSEKAKTTDVICDVTIAFPLLVSALLKE